MKAGSAPRALCNVRRAEIFHKHPGVRSEHTWWVCRPLGSTAKVKLRQVRNAAQCRVYSIKKTIPRGLANKVL